MAFIEAEKLSKTFGSGPGAVAANSGISFSLAAGGALGLLGPNGAGKTTLIKQLAGLLRPDSGRALIGGLDPAQDPPELRGRLGLLLEGMRNVYPYLTGRANLVYFGCLAGLSPEEAARRSAELLERFGLSAAADKYVMAYSAGMNRKLAVATCLMGRAELVILDEPTAGLDPASADALAVLVAELSASGGRTFILAGHDMRFMSRAAKEVLWLKEGRVRRRCAAPDLAALPAFRAVNILLRDSRGLREKLAAAGVDFSGEGRGLSLKLDPAGRAGLLSELLASGDLLSVSGGGDLEDAFREVSVDTAEG